MLHSNMNEFTQIEELVSDKESEISPEALNEFARILKQNLNSFEDDTDRKAMELIFDSKYDVTKSNIKYLLALNKRVENGVVKAFVFDETETTQ